MKPSFVSPDIRTFNTLQRHHVSLNVTGCRAVALDCAASAVTEALSHGTLHDWATGQLVREELHGRGIIYSVNLLTTPATPVVVRRNRHGGLLGDLTGEYFLFPTRAPLELATSLRLAAAGIPTPEIIAYAIYPAVGIFARSDVMTRRLPQGNDFPEAWKSADKTGRDALLTAVAKLLGALTRAGVWHADLNLKNIYIAGWSSDLTAYLLDVDRVTFPGGDIEARNLKRLLRSSRKWRERWGLDFSEHELARLTDLVRENR
jgi:3-deoxy-D-manno-octulosonic acid kinase